MRSDDDEKETNFSRKTKAIKFSYLYHSNLRDWSRHETRRMRNFVMPTVVGGKEFAKKAFPMRQFDFARCRYERGKAQKSLNKEIF